MPRRVDRDVGGFSGSESFGLVYSNNNRVGLDVKIDPPVSTDGVRVPEPSLSQTSRRVISTRAGSRRCFPVTQVLTPGYKERNVCQVRLAWVAVRGSQFS